MTAALFTTLGLGCLAPGIVGMILGALELRSIRKGDAPPAGEPFAKVALYVGALEGITLLGWLAYVVASGGGG